MLAQYTSCLLLDGVCKSKTAPTGQHHVAIRQHIREHGQRDAAKVERWCAQQWTPKGPHNPRGPGNSPVGPLSRWAAVGSQLRRSRPHVEAVGPQQRGGDAHVAEHSAVDEEHTAEREVFDEEGDQRRDDEGAETAAAHGEAHGERAPFVEVLTDHCDRWRVAQTKAAT